MVLWFRKVPFMFRLKWIYLSKIKDVKRMKIILILTDFKIGRLMNRESEMVKSF